MQILNGSAPRSQPLQGAVLSAVGALKVKPGGRAEAAHSNMGGGAECPSPPRPPPGTPGAPTHMTAHCAKDR